MTISSSELPPILKLCITRLHGSQHGHKYMYFECNTSAAGGATSNRTEQCCSPIESLESMGRESCSCSDQPQRGAGVDARGTAGEAVNAPHELHNAYKLEEKTRTLSHPN